MNDLTVILRERNPETDPDCHAAADLIDRLLQSERELVEALMDICKASETTSMAYRLAMAAMDQQALTKHKEQEYD